MELVSFEEFLELIARVAHYKAKRTNQEMLPLCKKLEAVISEVINLAECKFKRYEEKIDVQYEDSQKLEERIRSRSPLKSKRAISIRELSQRSLSKKASLNLVPSNNSGEGGGGL